MPARPRASIAPSLQDESVCRRHRTEWKGDDDMDHVTVLAEAEDFVKRQLAGDSSGHDWWHIARVRSLARTIAGQEGADEFVCELAALLHDVADDKLAGSEEAGLRTLREWLAARPMDAAIVGHVLEIVATMSFAGGN